MAEKVPDASDVPLYSPAPDEPQFTVRAVVAGCLLGGLICSMNLRFGLITGWSIGGSLITAILSFAMFQAASTAFGVRPFSRLETNIAQTAGSAAGSMTSAAGLLAPIPALGMLGVQLRWWELVAWAASVAWLGVFYAVPLRRQMVLVEKLRFPTGTATAETILAMYGGGEDASKKARYLLGFAVLAGAFTLMTHFLPWVGHPPLEEWLPYAPLVIPASYGFSLLISPMMTGAGMLIGARVTTSLLLGAVIGWGVLAPLAHQWGWAPGKVMAYGDGARGWILWPGVAIMVSEALASLVMSWRTFLGAFKRVEGDALDTSQETIPNAWWIGGLLLAGSLTITVSYMLFRIPPYMTVLAIALSSVLAMIAVRSTGETDINPTGGMGKVTQLAFGALAPGQITTNLMSAAITGSGASQAGDMMQDLKTGWLLGASPRKQIVAQLLGIGAGVVFVVPAYLLFNAAYDIGGVVDDGRVDLPAPAAHAWKAMAELLSRGPDALPPHAAGAVIAGLVFGATMAVLNKVLGKPWWLPSGLAVGIAFIVHPYYSIAMFAGAMVAQLWQRQNREAALALGFSVASGLIAGEGLMGVGNALLSLMGIGGG